MVEEYKKSFTEVSKIIELMPDELKVKIPQNFKDMLNKYKNENYFPNIKEPIENCNLMEETVIILGIIYSNYLLSESESKKLKKEDEEILIQAAKTEQQMLEEILESLPKKDGENVFENIELLSESSNNLQNSSNNLKKDEDITQNSEETRITVKKQSWIDRILNLIKKFFGKS